MIMVHIKNFILISLLLITLNCSGNKVTNVHGFSYIDEKYNKITINKTNKNDVRKIIGPPSSVSDFEDTWFYIERKKLSQSLFKLGKKKIKKNNVLALTFNKNGLLTNKEFFDIDDMIDLEISEKTTKKKFSQNSFGYDILSTLREKINAPVRNRRK